MEEMRGLPLKKKWLFGIGGIFFLVVAALGLMTWQLVHPARMAAVKPKGFRIEKMPSVRGPLSIYLSPNLAKGKPSPVFYLLAHGRKGSRADLSILMEMMEKRGMDCAAVPMPGQDDSPEDQISFGPNASNVLVRAVDHLEKKVGKEKLNVVLIGFDAGAAAAWLTAQRDTRIRGVVSVNGYADLHSALPRLAALEGTRMPQWVGRLVARGVEWVSNEPIETIRPIDAAKEFKRPAMVVHGALESVYGVDDAEELARASRADLWIVKGGAENAGNLVGRDVFVKHLEDFSKRVIEDVRDQTLYRKISRYKPKRLMGESGRIATTEEIPEPQVPKKSRSFRRLGWLGI
jgi:pimeloyl-ACP methyl ester carboxylesterase